MEKRGKGEKRVEKRTQKANNFGKERARNTRQLNFHTWMHSSFESFFSFLQKKKENTRKLLRQLEGRKFEKKFYRAVVCKVKVQGS